MRNKYFVITSKALLVMSSAFVLAFFTDVSAAVCGGQTFGSCPSGQTCIGDSTHTHFSCVNLCQGTNSGICGQGLNCVKGPNGNYSCVIPSSSVHP